jgi:SAM-dependent methyltransferase
MPPQPATANVRPSLEALVESGLLHLDSLHPGGLELARELAAMCGIEAGSRVLDVAAGTGETACLLAQEFAARVVAVDASAEMMVRAQSKAESKGLGVEFQQADAGRLPFADAAFDVAICECTLCLLDKRQVIGEMTRVVRSGGRVGMHDLCWQPEAPEQLKRALAELEGERPETLDGWRRLFAAAGLVDIRAVDKSQVKATWMRDSRRQLGVVQRATLVRQIVARWGVRGLWTIVRSQRVFSNRQLGYGLVLGTRP